MTPINLGLATFAASALLTLTMAPTIATAAKASDIEAIREISTTWTAHYQSGNFAAIPELYTEDTLVMPRGRAAIVGREQMRKAIGGLAAGRKVDMVMQEREIKVLGDYAWAVTDFAVTYTPRDQRTPPKTEHARGMVIFKKSSDGKWRIHRDMDSPAPPAVALTGTASLPTQPTSSGGPPVWDPQSREVATDCDRLASSRYDRTRLAEPRARADIDVPAAIAICERDLLQLPGDPRIHFHLGRLYGYAGDAEKTRFHRQASAAAGNHNAIFLLAYLDFQAARTAEARCEAASRIRLAADRGNYSGQVTYATYFLQGRLAACDAAASAAEVVGYARAARPVADGFFETLLTEHLVTALE